MRDIRNRNNDFLISCGRRYPYLLALFVSTSPLSSNHCRCNEPLARNEKIRGKSWATIK